MLLRCALALILAAAAYGQTQTSGHYRVTLRAPEGGAYAREETQIEFRVEDTTRPDPVSGFTAVVRATAAVTIDMPEMRGMPRFVETAHAEGVPGDYGVHPTFAHGGTYRARIAVTPPGGEAFIVEFPIVVADASPKRKATLPRYSLVLAASRARAGAEAELVLTVKDRENGPVRDFEMTHEAQMHLVIVRKDLAHFGHEHPMIKPDGSFRLRYTFVAGGEYRLFADVAPRGAGSQVVSTSLRVDGPRGEPFDIRKQEMVRTREAGGTTVEVSEQRFLTRTAATVDFAMADSSGSEPYLGAAGHLMLVHENGEVFVHSHPEEGSLRFAVRFPIPGMYRGWLQGKRNGQVWTADFLFSVIGIK